MSAPKRIQRQRTKGWRMPEGAVYVGRPSLWGNPWRPRDFIEWPGVRRADRAEAAVRMYRKELTHWGLMSEYAYYVSGDLWEQVDAEIAASGARNMEEYAAIVLRGRDLACWCPLDKPCHADVLLELANR